MHWQTKARAFRALSAVPFGTSLHFLLQRHVTRRLPRPEKHIPKDDIFEILKETRILRPGGVALMRIDYGDHFKGFDPSISSFNFLTYSDDAWRGWRRVFRNWRRKTSLLSGR